MPKINKGLVFDIQRLCTHDGPGNRTTVFFKGCNLRCIWCHNPESWSNAPEVMYYKNKCGACGLCAEDKTAVCPNGAREIKGEWHTPESLANICLRDRVFYGKNGGVTVSGGEPMLQVGFLACFLKILKSENIHTAVDTAGNVPFEDFEVILPYTDLFLYDIKAFDSELHEKITGAKNALIKSNLIKLCESGAKIWVRVPVIPGINDSEREQNQIDGFIPEKIIKTERLVYHKMASNKYAALGKTEKTESYLK